jgi:hypothetical protein
VRFVSTEPSSAPQARDAKSQSHLRIVEEAARAYPIRPRRLLLVEFGAVAGFFAALALVLLAESRRRKVRDDQELARLAGVAVLGSVNGRSGLRRLVRSLAVPTRTGWSELGSYGRLATQIAVANGDVAPQSLLVVGAEGPEESGPVAAKLALALARDAKSVVLADFSNDGTIASIFEIGKGKDAGPLVRRSTPLRDGDITVDRFHLRLAMPLVIAVPRSLPRSLSLAEARSLVGLLTAEEGILLIHGPSPIRSRRALTWARAVGASLLVVRSEHTNRDNVVAAVVGLESVPENLVGTVLAKGRS